MSDCYACPVEKDCHYPFRPCDCVHQRKFWDQERRADYDATQGVRPHDGQISNDGLSGGEPKAKPSRLNP